MRFLNILVNYYIIIGFFIFLSLIILFFLLGGERSESQSNIDLELIDDNYSKAEKNINDTTSEIHNITNRINNNTNKINNTILNETIMFYCFKLQNNKKVYESYLSMHNFYEFFNYRTPHFRTYVNDKLYEQTYENGDCDLIVREYKNIYENFKLNFEYNFKEYKCNIVDFDERIFQINNSLTICTNYIDDEMEAIDYEY
ncbi:MAG: hypothetical protein ACOC16_02825 [Nanoarchaeota archaeon]